MPQTSASKASGGKNQQKWLEINAYPVGSLEARTEADDLEFLKKVIGGRRIVQLGEGGHGISEYSRAKTRLIKFLHREMGFEVIAFESSFYQCYRSDLAAGAVNPQKSLIDCLFGVWHTREVLELFEYIKNTRGTKRPLRYTGFDIQPIGRNKRARPDFLKKIVARRDPGYADEVYALDQLFLREYARGSGERRKFFRANREKMIGGYERLAEFLEKNRGKLEKTAENPGDVLAAIQTARFLARYISQQTAPDLKEMFERRDRGMAENIRFILERLYPGKKLIIWGHNTHIRYKNEAIPPTEEIYPKIATRMMGSWLKERYAKDIYTVGFYAYAGRAANNRRKIYEINKPEEGTLEALLNEAGEKYLFVDLLGLGNKQPDGWAFGPVEARYNGLHPQKLIPAEQYDGLFFIKNVSPPEYLY